jgi:hypothetical protein
MRWLSASAAASSCAFLLAGCGGDGAKQATPPRPRPPRIPAAVAQRLAAEADLIAAAKPGSCTARAAAARLQVEAIRTIQQVPKRYQEPLMSAANDLVSRLSQCTEPTRREDDKPGHGKKHGKKKGH